MKINPRIFWANVKSLRIENEWSQAQLATKVGLDPKTYSNKERTSPKVSMELAKKIAEVFETKIEQLTDGEEPEEPLYDPEIVRFFNNVRIKRESLGITQKTMAEMLNMKPNNWNNKELGKAAKLPNSLMEQIAEVLECSVDELRGEKETVKPPASSKDQTTNIIVEKPIKTVLYSNSMYDMSHLSEPIQKFISKKENKDIIEELIKDFVLRQYMEEK